jgi:4-carboxymuconolactone decarboxylase
MLHFPQFGDAVWDVIEALTRHSTLPRRVREVAVLVTGTRYSSRYEIYAHELAGEKAGLSASKIASLAAGVRPGDLDADESVGYAVVSALTRGATLPESIYQAALATFGEHGTAELLYLVGTYCLVSVLLNGYDVAVPARAVSASPDEAMDD